MREKKRYAAGKAAARAVRPLELVGEWERERLELEPGSRIHWTEPVVAYNGYSSVSEGKTQPELAGLCKELRLPRS